MTLKKYQSYIYTVFLKTFILISLIFFCLVIIINFFDEIRFSEKNNIDIYYSIYLSLLNAPSLIFEIFPFIFLITVKVFFLKLSDNNEFKIFNSNGISNFRIVFILVTLSSLIGLFLLLFFYSFSSSLKSEYLDLKNKFSNTNEYLAVVKDDGLWIKEGIENSVYFIHAKKFNKNDLKSITISEIDKYYKSKNTITAEKANIISKNWYLENVYLVDNNGNKNFYKSLVYNSSLMAK